MQAEKRVTLALSLQFTEGERAYIRGGNVCVTSEEILSTATSRPLTEEELTACFLKTDGLPIDVIFDEVRVQGNIFIPKSQLNGIRRKFYETFLEKVQGARETLSYSDFPRYKKWGKNEKTAVIADCFTGIQTDIAVYKPKNFAKPLPSEFIQADFEKYIYFE